MIKKIIEILSRYNIDPPKELIGELNNLIENKFLVEKYEKLFNNSGLSYQSLDMDGKIIDINKTWLKVLNYEEEEVIGKWFGEFVQEDYIEIFNNQFEKFKNNKKVDNIRLKLKKKNNEDVMVLFNGCVIYNPDGNVNYSLCFFNDITNEDALFQELKASEEKYRRLTENSPEITYINSLKKGAVYWSSRVKDILGFDPKKIIIDTKLWTNSLYKDDVPHINKILKSIEVGKTYELEYRIYDVNNKIHWFYDRIFNVYEYAGEIIVEGIITDITQQKETEQLLRESEEKFRAISNSAQDAIILINHHGNVIFWNKAAQHIFQYTQGEILGKNLHETITPSVYLPSYFKAFEKFVETGEGNAINKIMEFTALKKDGEIIPIELSLSALKLGNKWHAVGILRDISERKRDEIKLKDKNKELNQLIATKDKFFSIIAHDLRNPIFNVVGFSDIISKNIYEYDREKLAHYMNILSNSAHRTSELLENLLIWSQSQRNTLTFNLELHNCNTLIDEVENETKHLMISKNISFSTVKPNNEIQVKADKNMFKTIFRNLISNAIKYTKSNGQIAIGYNISLKNQIDFFVKDNGVGIPDETISKLFKIDESISTAGTNQEKGTGLGLIICKEFIEKHNGKIWVESIVNQGSTFYFSFPEII